MERSWTTQVYDPDGKWVGFFENEKVARAWVKKRPGYEVTDRRPERRSEPAGEDQE